MVLGACMAPMVLAEPLLGCMGITHGDDDDGYQWL